MPEAVQVDFRRHTPGSEDGLGLGSEQEILACGSEEQGFLPHVITRQQELLTPRVPESEREHAA